MRQADGNKRLRWAFGLALLLHAAALGAAARLPDAVGSLNGDFEEIRVFGASVPAFASRVDLVEWPAEAPSGDAIELANVDPAPAQTGPTMPTTPDRVPTVRPPSREPDREPVRPAPEPVVRTGEPVEPAVVTPVPAAPEAAPEVTPADVAPSDEPGQTGDGVAPGGGGGGGGGSVGLGSPSPNGTIALGGSGETPPGQLPGEGEGSGPGIGPGSGGGTGGGSGGGTGTGEGTGEGEGSGSGTGGGEGDGGTGAVGSGSTSRVADRREPEVLWKGDQEYPASAARDGVEGTVLLRVLVGEAGDVLEMEVIESSGDRRLDVAAEEFVRTWRFLPAVQDGKPRRVHTEAKVTFRLT